MDVFKARMVFERHDTIHRTHPRGALLTILCVNTCLKKILLLLN